MQIICTLLQTDNHASTSSIFYKPDAVPGIQPGLSKICRDAGTDAGTVRQRRKTPRLVPGQVCDAGTDVWTDCQRLTRRLSLHTQRETPGQVNSDRHAS